MELSTTLDLPTVLDSACLLLWKGIQNSYGLFWILIVILIVNVYVQTLSCSKQQYCQSLICENCLVLYISDLASI